MVSFVDETCGGCIPSDSRPARGCLYSALILANVGLFLSICVSAMTFLPLTVSFVDLPDLRFVSGIAVIGFLDASFWLSGWPGSALAVSLMGMALFFAALLGRTLGLVALMLTVLMAALVLLLMMSDLPLLRARGWSGRRLSVGIGLAANVIVAAVVLLLWWTFGRMPGA